MPGVIALPIRISSRGQRAEQPGQRAAARCAAASATAYGVLAAEGARRRRRSRRSRRPITPTARPGTPASRRRTSARQRPRRPGRSRPISQTTRSSSSDVEVAGRVGERRLQRVATAAARPGRAPRPGPRETASASAGVGAARRSQPDDDQRDRRGRRGAGRVARPLRSSGAAVTAGRRPAGRARPPEQLVLQAEHLALLVRLGVVVAEQVQDAVHGQQVELVVHACGRPVAACSAATCGQSTTSPSRPGSGRAPPSVAPRSAAAARPSGRPARRSGPARPSTATCSSVHGVVVDQQHRQLGQRVDPHPVEHEPGERGQRRLVDLAPGLVGDLDAHPSVRRRDRAWPVQRGPAGRGRAGRLAGRAGLRLGVAPVGVVPS